MPNRQNVDEQNACDPMHGKHWRDFCRPDSDANQFRLGSSILKYAGYRGVASVEGVGAMPPTSFFFQIYKTLHECITKAKLQNRSCLKNYESHKKKYQERKKTYLDLATSKIWTQIFFLLQKCSKTKLCLGVSAPRPQTLLDCISLANWLSNITD